MGIAAIASGIFSVAKAVPYVFKVLDAVYAKYIEHKISKIKQQRITKDDQRSALLQAIEKAETNEEILALSVTLHTINNGGLREPNA